MYYQELKEPKKKELYAPSESLMSASVVMLAAVTLLLFFLGH